MEGARRRLAAEDGPREELAATDRKLRELLLAREDLRARRQVAARPAPAPLGLPEIREQVLDDDTLLLEYALGEEASRLWAVDRGSLAVFRLPPRSVLEAQARRVDGLLPRSHERGVRRQAALAAAMLSRSLLGPLAGRLGGRRLLIVADGALQSVSFAALPDPDSPAGEPLLARHEIVPLPSASVLALLRRQLAGRRPPPHRLVVIADPVFEPGDPRLPAASGLAGGAPVPAAGAPALARQGEGGRFARLPFTRREAEELLRLVPGRERLAALDFAASRETVLSGRLGRYRIVHFATHALLDDEHPELSGLVLARFDERGRPRDGLLRTYEIDDLDLPVDLVVLSACRTARGREIRGEGLLGLTRGFLHAGAARVLVSLWNVDDEATAELMRRFYRLLLGERLPASRALREAQLSLRGDPRWGAPYYWAGFTLQGEWR